jgi:hypothetical protein
MLYTLAGRGTTTDKLLALEAVYPCTPLLDGEMDAFEALRTEAGAALDAARFVSSPFASERSSAACWLVLCSGMPAKLATLPSDLCFMSMQVCCRGGNHRIRGKRCVGRRFRRDSVPDRFSDPAVRRVLSDPGLPALVEPFRRLGGMVRHLWSLGVC